MQAFVNDLHWWSDWNGYEVGFPECNVVGLYHSEKLDCDFYIDVETNEILQVFKDSEEI